MRPEILAAKKAEIDEYKKKAERKRERLPQLLMSELAQVIYYYFFKKRKEFTQFILVKIDSSSRCSSFITTW